MNQLDGQISLDEYLTSLDGPLDETETEMGTDDVWANRMLRELAAAEKNIRTNTAMADAERAKITAWEAVVNDPLQKRALWLREQLEKYAVYVRTNEDRKTVHLPFGKITTTPKADEWLIDAESFVAWARTAGVADLYRVPEPVPNRTVIKGAFAVDSEGHAVDTATGETIPGIEVRKSDAYNIQIKTT
jgi:hypothetical protein